MQLRDIEYFAVVAEHRSLHRAAEALGLSQPALSKSLRRLEGSVGAKIVRRSPKGVELTAVGEALLARVSRLRLTLDDIAREAKDLSQGRAGHLRIGTAATLALHPVAPACEALLEAAPRVTMKMTISDNSALLAGLRNGTLDLALTTIPAHRHSDLVEDRLYTEEFVIFGSAKHRLAGKQVSLADLAHERWATGHINGTSERQLVRLFADAGLPPPTIAVETPFLPLRHQLVAASDLITFNSKRVAHHAAKQCRVVEFRVKDLSYTRPIGVLYRKDAYLPPAARTFLDILKVTAKKLSAE